MDPIIPLLVLLVIFTFFALAFVYASRVKKVGPNEVLVSNTVKDLVAGSGLRFADRGATDVELVRWEGLAQTIHLVFEEPDDHVDIVGEARFAVGDCCHRAGHEIGNLEI